MESEGYWREGRRVNGEGRRRENQEGDEVAKSGKDEEEEGREREGQRRVERE